MLQAVRKATLERLAPLPQSSTSAACKTWLGQLAKDMQWQCPALMAACTSPASFAALESQLEIAILQWQPLKMAATGEHPTAV